MQILTASQIYDDGFLNTLEDLQINNSSVGGQPIVTKPSLPASTETPVTHPISQMYCHTTQELFCCSFC